MFSFSELSTLPKIGAYCAGATVIATTFWFAVGPGIDGHIRALAEDVVKKQVQRVEQKIGDSVTQSKANGIAIQEILQEQARAKTERNLSRQLDIEQRDLSRQILLKLDLGKNR